jgi:hypothetical protein
MDNFSLPGGKTFIYLFIFYINVSYYDVARLAHVAGLETHIGSVFRKGFLL